MDSHCDGVKEGGDYDGLVGACGEQGLHGVGHDVCDQGGGGSAGVDGHVDCGLQG